MSKLPPYAAFYNPVLEALRNLGGSGSVGEIYDKVVQIMEFSKDEMEILHNSEGKHKTEIE